MEKFKLDEENIARLFAWPRFLIGASLVTIFAVLIFTGSVVFGYSLKLMGQLRLQLRNLVAARKLELK